MTNHHLMKKEEEFKAYQGQTNPFPYLIDVDRADGIYIYDKSGKPYMDMIAGVAVNNTGHNNKSVNDALKKQIDKHLHVMVYGEFIQDSTLDLCKNLIALLPQNLNSVYCVNSGTEANEAALKLAKRVTGRSELVSFRGSYHGSTHGSMSVSGNETKKEAFRPLLPDVRFLSFNNTLDLEQISHKTAGVIIETIQGDAGVRIPELAFLKALRKKCDDTGTMLIFDEIQCGMGRAGSMFAFEQFGIVPDILLLGKALGGGMPLGAFVASKQMMDSFTLNPVLGHITTFGGNPLCCAASKAGIEVLLENKHWMDVCQRETLLRKGLVHPKIKAIRSFGFLMAMELDSFDTCVKLMHAAMAKGVLVDWFLFAENCIRIAQISSKYE